MESLRRTYRKSDRCKTCLHRTPRDVSADADLSQDLSCFAIVAMNGQLAIFARLEPWVSRSFGFDRLIDAAASAGVAGFSAKADDPGTFEWPPGNR